MTRIIDVSLAIGPRLLVWPGDPAIEITPSARMAKGDPANVSELRLGSHTGTHVDPPFHFIDGAQTVDRISLEILVGEAYVADVRGSRGAIGPDQLQDLKLPPSTRRLLLRTDNSALWADPDLRFPAEYVSISAEGAAWLVDAGVRLIGVDFLSIEQAHVPGHPTHQALLAAGVVIVEGLDLSEVEPGTYTFVCLPLKILGGDGAPARAILLEGER